MSLISRFHEVRSIGAFTSDLGIGVFVNKKRLAKYLLGGVLLVVLLIGGYVLLSSENPVGVVNRDHVLDCIPEIQAMCRPGGTVNASEITGCGSSISYKDIKSLDSVEDVNGSTGVVTCDRPQFR
jgi:hypothetical protein